MKRPISDLKCVSDLTSGQRLRLQRSKLTEVNHQFLAQCLSLITSKLLRIEQLFCHHCVPHVKLDRMILNLTLKSQGQSLT